MQTRIRNPQIHFILQSGNSIQILCEKHENIDKITGLADEILFCKAIITIRFQCRDEQIMVIQCAADALTTE